MIQTLVFSLIPVVAGVVIGWIRRGSVRAIPHTTVHLWPVLLAGVALTALAEIGGLPDPILLSAAVTGMFLLVAALGLNLHLRGTTITSIGVMLNLTVLVLNGHVPVRPNGLVELGRIDNATSLESVVSVGALGRLETAATKLPLLGDVLVIGWLDMLASFGDLIAIAGLAIIVQNSMLRPTSVGVSVDDLFGPISEDRIDDGDGPGSGRPLELDMVDLRDAEPDDGYQPIWAPDPEPVPSGHRAAERRLAPTPGFAPRGIPAGLSFSPNSTAMERLAPLPYEDGDVRVIGVFPGTMPSPVHV